ncbi:MULTISPECIES: DUF2281 domain-containing protein [Dyadobacter]|uniref:DUF2281 domain-containing protein n=2 Tax=Dyadobacter TaxID=120831 RepID=A0A5R9KDM5_9BACT|nr:MULTISPECIES: DUF2281 domain-containing protein [Dyadobacter]KAA6436667.1 DUF2281 domain-containing protein [Dyadobacter flavalbus]TLU94193.1 DUF2281 domain-containing protein [Dyadobacter sediminis]GGB93442.1 hypothetical protein GCM10011325_21050 [Dyadobacter sediminis]
MLTTVKGTYRNGKVTLEEPLPVSFANVIVTVLEDETSEHKSVALPKRKFGIMKGSVKLPDDFNDPLDDLNEYL